MIQKLLLLFLFPLGFQKGRKSLQRRRCLLGLIQIHFQIFQNLKDLFRHGLLLHGAADRCPDTRKKQMNHAHTLVKGSMGHFRQHPVKTFSAKDGFHLIIGLVFLVEIVIGGKIPGNLRVLDILEYQVRIHSLFKLLIDLDDPGKILPASRRGEFPALHRGLHLVKIAVPKV